MIVFLNGKFLESSEAKVSVFDNGFLYADGVYETLRTYGGKIWQIKKHLSRLRQSAQLLEIRLPWKARQLQLWIQETVKRNGFEESRIRVTFTRGTNGFGFSKTKAPTLLIVVEPLIPQPGKVFSKGVKVVTYPIQRVLPQAKSLNLLPMILAQQSMQKKKAYEALFIDAAGTGNTLWVREGTVTNVFMVKKNVLLTPKNHILAGTTRDFILTLANRLGVKIIIRDISLKEFYQADEIFITNAPRGIVPVIKVDGHVIGKNVPGPVTKFLRQQFEKNVLKSA